MSEPQYVQVNVGRNVGDVPMTAANWGWFQDSVKDAIASAIRRLTDVDRALIMPGIETHIGMGAWGASGPEESAHISIVSWWPVDVDYLRGQLATIAKMFEQDAVALIANGSELVQASAW